MDSKPSGSVISFSLLSAKAKLSIVFSLLPLTNFTSVRLQRLKDAFITVLTEAGISNLPSSHMKKHA